MALGFERIRALLEKLENGDSGYWFTVEELEAGLNAVAAPIRRSDGSVVAAVSVLGPAFRMPAESFPETGELCVLAADEISRCLGFHA